MKRAYATFIKQDIVCPAAGIRHFLTLCRVHCDGVKPVSYTHLTLPTTGEGGTEKWT